MSAVDLLLIAVLAVLILCAVLSVRRARKKGGGCAGCRGGCAECKGKSLRDL